ncbi:MAG: hypothetical protein WCB04_04065, partial [Mycobacteriales bacterium]
MCSDRTIVCQPAGPGSTGRWYARFFSNTGSTGPWEDRGVVCIGTGETPVSTDALFGQIRGYVDQLIPAAPTVSMQPAGTT